MVVGRQNELGVAEQLHALVLPPWSGAEKPFTAVLQMGSGSTRSSVRRAC